VAVILGYWDIHGLAHIVHLFLEYTDSNYEEKNYMMRDTPAYDRSQWLKEKFKLGLDFPNLPYLIHEERFMWTFWRTRLYTSPVSWPVSPTALISRH
uniref:GST N-terminal domain-containing protein n=1 Tax=Equus asinus TaxID=9793 RepID=A0A9L0IWM9_EQUAS